MKRLFFRRAIMLAGLLLGGWGAYGQKLPVKLLPAVLALPAPASLQNALIRQSVRPATLESFCDWMSQVQTQHPTRLTTQALQNLQAQIDHYKTLSPQEQLQVTYLVNHLGQARGKVGSKTNGHFYKLVYRGTLFANQLPAAENFHLLAERSGFHISSPEVKKLQRLSLPSLFLLWDNQDSKWLRSLGIYQGFQLPRVKRELEQALEVLIPPGYEVRINSHELGLSNNRENFRKGKLHMHFEKQNVQPGKLDTDLTIELGLTARPLAGIIHPKTGKILVPFPDKTIAANYLTLLRKYLTYTDEAGTLRYTKGGKLLRRIAEGKSHR